MKIACIVLNYNLPQDTISLVSDLKKQTVKPEIIVVDNASADNSVLQIKKSHPDIKIIGRKVNDGVAGGYNAGVKEALKNNPDFIAVLNNDLEIKQKDCLEDAIAALQHDTRAGIAGPMIYFARGYEYHPNNSQNNIIWFAGGKIDWQNIYHSHRGVDEIDKNQYSNIETTDFLTGAFMLFKKEVFEKIGFFNEKYALYLEDAEICERAGRAGFKLLFVPSAKIFHKVSQTLGNEIGGNLNDYYLTRNRLLFGMQFASLQTKLALIREAVKLLFIGRPYQKRGVGDFFFGKFGKL